jgi:hypothetical protein
MGLQKGIFRKLYEHRLLSSVCMLNAWDYFAVRHYPSLLSFITQDTQVFIIPLK